MDLEELEKRISNIYLDDEKKVKIPYSDGAFNREVDPPHLMYTEIDSDNLAADDIVFLSKSNSRLELTTDFRARDLEKIIQSQVLYDIVYTKEVNYIHQERVWNVSYYFQLLEKEN